MIPNVSTAMPKSAITLFFPSTILAEEAKNKSKETSTSHVRTPNSIDFSWGQSTEKIAAKISPITAHRFSVANSAVLPVARRYSVACRLAAIEKLQ